MCKMKKQAQIFSEMYHNTHFREAILNWNQLLIFVGVFAVELFV